MALYPRKHWTPHQAGRFAFLRALGMPDLGLIKQGKQGKRGECGRFFEDARAIRADSQKVTATMAAVRLGPRLPRRQRRVVEEMRLHSRGSGADRPAARAIEDHKLALDCYALASRRRRDKRDNNLGFPPNPPPGTGEGWG